MTDCNNPKNDNERALCSCLSATNLAVQTGIQNDNLRAEYTLESASYNRWKIIHDDWINKRNNYQKYSGRWGRSDSFWSNERGMYHCGWATDSWSNWDNSCSNRTDGKYIVDRNANNNWCEGRKGIFKCVKKDNVIQSEISEYNSAEPLTDPQNSSKRWQGVPQPQLQLNPINMQGLTCCSQLFSNINVGQEFNLSATQNCSTQINNTLATPPTPPTPPPRSGEPVPVTEIKTINNKEETTQSNNNLFYIIIILIVLIVLLFAIMSSFIFMKKR